MCNPKAMVWHQRSKSETVYPIVQVIQPKCSVGLGELPIDTDKTPNIGHIFLDIVHCNLTVRK